MRHSTEQIRITPSGYWHSRERIDGGGITSCGLAFVVYQSRYGGFDHLCPKCFTREEIETGEIERIKLAHAGETGALYHDPDEEPTDPNGHIDPNES